MAYQHLWRMAQCGQPDVAAFRLWGSTYSAAIQALGWVKTADTGQIDWLTVGVPTVSGQKMGYEIYRAADGLQGSAPWFLRFDYGASPNAPARPGLYLTFGSGTNGAGTLTGASNEIRLDLNSQQVTAPRLHLFVGDGAQGQLGIIGGVQEVDTCWAFFLERTQVKGVVNSVGGVLLYMGYGLGPGARNVPSVMVHRWGQAAQAGAVAPTLAGPNAPRKGGHFDTGSIVQPVFYNLGTGFLAGPVHNAFIVDPTSIPVGVGTDVPHDGATQRFFVSARPEFYPTLETVGGSPVDYRLAMRWE